MSQTLAAECRLVVGKFLEAQEADGVLSFRYSLTATSVSEGPSGRAAIRVTFSRPSAASPAPAAVVHVRFLLSETMDQVAGFLLEEDPHIWPTEDVAFDDRTLQRVLDRKLRVRDARFVNVFDDFSSTRVPAAIRETQNRDRQHDRESLEEQLLEYFQRKDPYNDGRLLLTDLVSAIRELDAQVLISGRGRPKLCAEFPKEVFFALAPPADRDELVEYGPLVPLAAEALDSWAGWNYYCQPDATMDAITDSSSTLRRENKDTDATNEVSERFTAVNRAHLQYQVQKLREVLETTAATNSAARHPVVNTKTEEVETFEEAKESDEPADDNDQQDENESTASTASLRAEHVPQYVNMRQLQSALELPCLLLSAPEINLIIALAVGANSLPGSDEEQFFPVSDIPSLLSRARIIIFSYQYRTFLVADKEGALEQYLARQFESFERDTLKGSSTHLSGKLTLKQVKQVVREELPRLALSVIQAGQVVAVCDALRHSTDDKVRYRECIAKVASVLRSEVTIEDGSGDDHGATSIIIREEEIRFVCLRVLGSLDDKQLGVLALPAFAEGIQVVADEIGFPINGDHDIRVLTAVADPTGSGRVNYAAFQHQMLPLTIALTRARMRNMDM